MEGKSANKVWRQKMLQAFGIAIFIVLVDMARRCAWYRVYSGTLASLVTLLLPVASLVVPLIILKKMVFGFLFGIGFTEIEIGW